MNEEADVKKCSGVECPDRAGCARFDAGAAYPKGPLAYDLRNFDDKGCLNYIQRGNDGIAEHRAAEISA